MNKPQFLAELGQLLIFMTGADRERTLSRYGALFDQAGPAGEQALMEKLGSPTRQAIRLSRIYDPSGSYDDPSLSELEAAGAAAPAQPPAPPAEPEQAPAPAPEPEKRVPAYDHSLVEEELPELDLPDLPDLPAQEPGPVPAPGPEPVPEPAPEPEQPDAPAEEAEAQAPSAPEAESAPDQAAPAPKPAPPRPEQAPDPTAPLPQPIRPQPRFISVPLDEQDHIPFPEEPAPVQRSMPLWVGVPLFILAIVCLAVPLGALILVLLPLLLVPGLAVLAGAWLTAVGGLWCVSYIADAVMLFGAAFFILGLALMVLFLGLWLDVALVKLYIRLMKGVKHLFLGRKVTSRA